MLEINVLINEVKNALFHLKEWTEPEKVRNNADKIMIYKYSYFSLQLWIFLFPLCSNRNRKMDEMRSNL